MANMDEELIRIGWSFTRGLAETLSTFILSFKNTTSADRNARAYQKKIQGKRFSRRDRFVAASMQKNKSADFENMKINNKDAKLFHKLCKQYGIDYLLEEKPNMDFQSIIDKPQSQRTQLEELAYKNWTEMNSEGRVIETPDDVKITFSVKDLNKMEFVVEDMLHKKHTLEKRKERAKATYAKAKATAQKTKENIVKISKESR